MGPNRQPELWKDYAASSVERITQEVHFRRSAEQTLTDLSGELNEYPVQGPVVESTLPAKLYALSHLNYDVVGMTGSSPMSVVDLGRDGASINAFAAPSHDSFVDERSGLMIHTRAILMIPPKGHYEEDTPSDLEYFGLNQYAGTDDSGAGAEPAEVSGGLFIPGNGGLVVMKGEPTQGVTNIFAVRHKEHGTVRMYAVTVDLNPLPAMGGGEPRYTGRNQV